MVRSGPRHHPNTAIAFGATLEATATNCRLTMWTATAIATGYPTWVRIQAAGCPMSCGVWS